MATESHMRLHASDLVENQPPLSERPKGHQHWSKTTVASETPRSHRLVARANQNALWLQAMVSRYRGGISVFACGLLVVGAFFLQFFVTSARDLLGSLAASNLGYATVDFIFLCASAVMMVIAFTAAIRSFRIDLLSPKEVPLVFNRKTRKVYRFVQDIPGLEAVLDAKGIGKKLAELLRYIVATFLPWPGMLLIEYDWDCLEAEYSKQTALAGNVVRTDHHLDLLVRESPDSDTIIGSFPLAPSVMLGEPAARNLWEHVRRYMEENGPALSPGDQPGQRPPKGFWQAANALFNGPGWLVFLAAAIWVWPETYWEFMFWTHEELRLVIPHSKTLAASWRAPVAMASYFFLAWVFFGVLASYLSKDVPLPAEALEGAGEPLNLDRLVTEVNAPAAPPEPVAQHRKRKA